MSEHAPLILHVEDERPIRRFVRPALEGQGYRVLEATTLQEGCALARSHAPDVVILDLGLPDEDGKELVRDLRQWTSIPIIVVTARERESDKVEALDLGADDYLTKPFSVLELLARLRVALRHASRAAGSEMQTPLKVGDLVVDLADRRVWLAGEKVVLSPIEYRLLAELARHPGRVLTHRALLQSVWGPGRTSEAHLVRVHMANLRKKLEADTARPRYILTETGVGYRLADE